MSEQTGEIDVLEPMPGADLELQQTIEDLKSFIEGDDYGREVATDSIRTLHMAAKDGNVSAAKYLIEHILGWIRKQQTLNLHAKVPTVKKKWLLASGGNDEMTDDAIIWMHRLGVNEMKYANRSAILRERGLID